MRRLLPIAALIIVASTIEIVVLIGVGQVIGVGWTLVLLLATAALGGALLRREGGRAWRAFTSDLADGRPPGPAVTDGLLVLLGGIMMLVPGFVSDLMGAFLIVPPTRHLARRLVLRLAADRMPSSTAMSLFGPRRVRVYQSPRHAGDDRFEPANGAGRSAPDGDRSTGAGAAEAIEGEIIDPG